jgi:hypothetical protein
MADAPLPALPSTALGCGLVREFSSLAQPSQDAIAKIMDVAPEFGSVELARRRRNAREECRCGAW